MKIISPRDYEICRATPSDIDCIFGWLRSEYKDDPDALNRVRASIRDADENRNDLWVCRQHGAAVGYQAGDYAPEYLFVRKKFRRNDVGTALVEASVARAMRHNLNVLEVQCEPITSLRFWLAVGFHDVSTASQVQARRFLHRVRPLPVDRPTVQVRIRTYDGEPGRNQASSFQPLTELNVAGAIVDEGLIQLDRRVLCPEPWCPNGDLKIWVEIDGNELVFDKAKSVDARRLGVEDDAVGSLLFIDRINLKAAPTD